MIMLVSIAKYAAARIDWTLSHSFPQDCDHPKQNHIQARMSM